MSRTILSAIQWATLFACFATTPAYGVLLEFKLEFPGGFALTVNGQPPAPSGPITIVGYVDSESIDIEPRDTHGAFPVDGVRFTGAGFVDQPVLTPLALSTFEIRGPTNFAFGIRGELNQGIVGWNGRSLSGRFMSDVNDLSTLVPLPYSTTGLSTFWANGLGSDVWVLAGGDTIGARIPNSGPQGHFSITIPEPTTLALAAMLTVCGMMGRRRQN